MDDNRINIKETALRNERKRTAKVFEKIKGHKLITIRFIFKKNAEADDKAKKYF